MLFPFQSFLQIPVTSHMPERGLKELHTESFKLDLLIKGTFLKFLFCISLTEVIVFIRLIFTVTICKKLKLVWGVLSSKTDPGCCYFHFCSPLNILPQVHLRERVWVQTKLFFLAGLLSTSVISLTLFQAIETSTRDQEN